MDHPKLKKNSLKKLQIWYENKVLLSSVDQTISDNVCICRLK